VFVLGVRRIVVRLLKSMHTVLSKCKAGLREEREVPSGERSGNVSKRAAGGAAYLPGAHARRMYGAMRDTHTHTHTVHIQCEHTRLRRRVVTAKIAKLLPR